MNSGVPHNDNAPQQGVNLNAMLPQAFDKAVSFDPGLVQLVLQLTDPSSERREQALTDLSKQRETFPDLAPMLWHSCGTIAALLQEIISIYPALSPPTLSVPASNRVCNALALLQCVASHAETRSLFLQGE